MKIITLLLISTIFTVVIFSAGCTTTQNDTDVSFGNLKEIISYSDFIVTENTFGHNLKIETDISNISIDLIKDTNELNIWVSINKYTSKDQDAFEKNALELYNTFPLGSTLTIGGNTYKLTWIWITEQPPNGQWEAWDFLRETQLTYTPTKTPTPNPTQTSTSSKFNQFTITVLDKVVGQKATDLIYNANQFNEIPPSGYTAYLVKVKISLDSLGNNRDYVYFIPYSYVRLYVDDVGYESPVTVMPSTHPKPEVRGAMTEGESVTGWLYFIAPSGSAYVKVAESYSISNLAKV